MRWLLGAALVLALIYLLRFPVMRAMGSLLITQDEPVHVDAIYALGGASLERGTEAARLFNAGWGGRVVTTSSMVPTIYMADGIDRTEAEVTRDVAIRNGVPAAQCFALNKGTSTKEEADAILAMALDGGQDTIMIVSSLFHMRRIRFVFRDRFRDAGIEVVLRGAPSVLFEEERWWEKEEGLMMCQNEYVKLLYYWWNY